MGGFLIKATLSSFLCVLVHLSFGEKYIIHEDEEWIKIINAEDLRRIGTKGFPLNGKYLQTQDIDLSDFSEVGGWRGIGQDTPLSYFIGVFDGGGYKINGLNINRNAGLQGLFTVVGAAGILKNISLTNVSIQSASGHSIGSLVARNLGHIINCTVINGVLHASSYSGGLVGRNDGTIEQCYSGIDVIGLDYIGGLAGANYGGIIKNSYSQGKVHGQLNTGGFIGRNTSSIINSYSSGLVNYEQSGGGFSAVNTGKIEGSYWNIESSRQFHSVGDEEGKSDSEMKLKSTFKNWDFDEVWQIKEGESMPFLLSFGEFTQKKEIPELTFSLNELPIYSKDTIVATYGDTLNFVIESTSDGLLSALKLELSDPLIVDISNFPEVRAIKTGTTILKIIQPETEKFDSKEVYFKISVGQKELLITPRLGQQKIYGEEDPSLEFIQNLESNDTLALSWVELKREEGEEVGSYAIQLNDVTAGDNYLVRLDTNIVYFKIIPREIHVRIDAKEKIYGNLDPDLTFQLLNDNLIEGDTFVGNLQREEGESAGLYYISSGNLDAGPNYLLIFENNGDFIINRASSEITADTLQIHVYDGSFKTIAANLNHREAQLVYSPDSSFVDAGTYDVHIHSTETANYLEANTEVTLMIQKAVQEGVVLEDAEYVYTGEERRLLVSGLAPDLENDVEITYENNGHIDAGVYSVIARIIHPNYEDLILHATLTIHKANAEIIADTDQVHVYDGIAKTIVASLNHEEGQLVYSPDSSFVDAGTYGVHIHSPETANYLETNTEVTLMIQKAVQEGVYFEDAEYVYTGEERYLSVFGLVPDLENDVEIIYEKNDHIDAGVYSVIARIIHPNYEDLILHATLTIHKANAEIIAKTDQIHVYDGSAKTIVASLNHEEGQLVYSPGSPFVDAGTYGVHIHSLETANYFEATKEVTLTIHKAIQEGVVLEDAEYVYTGEEKRLSVSGLAPDLENDVEITYENNGHIDVGIYEVIATIKSMNYEDLILNAMLTIHKANAEITVDTLQIHVYDGTSKTIVASLNHVEGQLVYSPGSPFVDAGTYGVHIHSPETANYFEATKEVTLTIHKAIQEGVVLEDAEYVYTGEERRLSVFGLASDLENDVEIIYENNGHIDAGIYEVIATIKRLNYEDLILNAILTIHKAKAEIIAETHQVHVYDGTLKSVVAHLNHSESDLIYESIKFAKNAGSYEIEVSSEESINFLKAYKKIALTIEEAVLIVKVENTNRVFGENNPDFTINYKGFKNGEDESVLISFPQVETMATIFSGIGEYIVTPSGALADNYVFEYIDGLLTITPTDFENINFENKTFIYDRQEYSLIVSNLPKDATVVYENNKHINAGIYTVTATISKFGYLDKVLKAVLTIEKAPQIISFEEVGKVSRSQSYIQMNAKSTSGLAIQLFSDDNLVASLDGHTLLIHRLGTVRVTASQEGDKNHEPAEQTTIRIEVEDKKHGPVRVHQALSPNGDGINDFLIVEGIKEFPDNRLQIINPLGELVFDIKNYDNELNTFQGVSNRGISGSTLPDGTYFYVLQYENNGRLQTQRGWIYLKENFGNK